MAARLADAVSPYLRSHADNPVDWWAWGPEPFAEAARRDVPVLISIGYATCHWCHVMARESFSDPAVGAYLNANVVAIKVDREEHPDVDAGYLSAASAFTENLGWPLTVFARPDGTAFFAGTYFPPEPVQGRASFTQVVDAVLDAWRSRRDQVDENADRLRAALRASAVGGAGDPAGVEADALPDDAALGAAARLLAEHEDTRFGGFGRAPKFPVVPVLRFLLERGTDTDGDAGALARRTLAAMAGSGLRDRVEGGFFRYAVHRDWTEPHYERMLTDNAQLLAAYADVGDERTASGIAGFLLDVMRLPSGGFASAQDSESDVDGQRSEGGYYALDAGGRRGQPAPALDTKVLTGWNGLALGALASAGTRLNRPRWVAAAEETARVLLDGHLDGGRLDGGSLRRASRDGRPSAAPSTLEDVGLLAGGLLDLALATGDAQWAVGARELIDSVLVDEPTDGGDAAASSGHPSGKAHGAAGRRNPAFRMSAKTDAVLAAAGLDLAADPSDGALPSGTAACALAALRLHALTGASRYRDAAARAVAPLAGRAIETPIAFGGALTALQALVRPLEQLVVVGEPDGELGRAARERGRGVVAVVRPDQAEAFAAAGFELFEGRGTRDGRDTAYACRDFVCRLPVTDVPALEATGALHSRS